MVNVVAWALLLFPTLSFSRSAEWGPPSNGLKCRIQIPAKVKQGDQLKVALDFSFDPQSSRGTFFLTEWAARDCSRLEFRDAKGTVHVRWPAVSGMPTSPGFCGEGIYRDLRAPGRPDTFRPVLFRMWL